MRGRSGTRRASRAEGRRATLASAPRSTLLRIELPRGPGARLPRARSSTRGRTSTSLSSRYQVDAPVSWGPRGWATCRLRPSSVRISLGSGRWESMPIPMSSCATAASYACVH
eukprot:8721985-Pyramimonas_sp.AAC.1